VGISRATIGRAAAESVVIVLSVLVAFGVESWREDMERSERELDYLSRLRNEFEVDASRIESALGARMMQQQHIDNAISILKSDDRNSDADLLSVFLASRSVWSREIGATFRELFGTGQVQAVSNGDLRMQLIRFHTWLYVAIVDAPGLYDRMPYRDIVRGEIDPKLQEAIRKCGGEQARILNLPDMNMVSACDFGAGEDVSSDILRRIRASPEALPALRRWAAAFTALESRLDESHARITEMRDLISEELARR